MLQAVTHHAIEILLYLMEQLDNDEKRPILRLFSKIVSTETGSVKLFRIVLTYYPELLNKVVTTHTGESGTALHFATHKGSTEVVRFLLNRMECDYETVDLKAVESSYSINGERKKMLKDLFKQKR